MLDNSREPPVKLVLHPRRDLEQTREVVRPVPKRLPSRRWVSSTFIRPDLIEDEDDDEDDYDTAATRLLAPRF
jgi:hypothetical protein